LIILCHYLGVTGVLWAGPLADFLAFVLALAFTVNELKNINSKAKRRNHYE
jgi:Na+-driven multidrug efflux pump